MKSRIETTIGEDLSVRLPEKLARRLDLSKGTRVTVEERGGILLIRPAKLGEREPLERFSKALGKIRTQADKVGGISQRQIDAAIRKVRCKQKA